MKFSVAPESSRVGASVLRCAAWTYAFRIIDFRLDMYTFSDVFLNHAACARRASTSSLWEVGSSVLSLWSLVESLVSCGRASGSSSRRSNVTDLFGTSDNLFIPFVRSAIGSVLLYSDSSESHNVSLFVESSSVTGSGVVSGFRNFSKHFIQKRVGCSLPHSSHRSGDLMSSLICSAYVRIGPWSFSSACCFRALGSVFIDRLGCGVFVVRLRAWASISNEWLKPGVWVRCSASYLA